MGTRNRWSAAVVWIATVNICFPWQVAGADEAEIHRVQPGIAQTAPQIVDISLSDTNMLMGQVLDTAGQPVACTDVALVENAIVQRLSKTDEQGRFQFDGVRGGTYQVATPGATTIVRAWAPRTAPPAAQSAALLIVDQDVVRAQDCGDGVACGSPVGPGTAYGGRPVLNWMRANPGIVVAGVAAAIAIPVAIAAADDDDPPPGS